MQNTKPEVSSYPLIQKMQTAAINDSFCYEEDRHIEEESVPVLQPAPVVQPRQVQVVAPFRPIQVQQVQPAYSTAGIPQIAHQPQIVINFQEHQRSVKCWSRFIYCFAALLVISGVMNIIGNVGFIFVMDSFANIGWYDREGNYRELQLHQGHMFLLALSKIIAGGFFFIKQGKLSIKIFGGILKEYRDAERGTTNGIRMVERKSNLMKSHKKVVKKITIATLFITLLAVMVTKEFLKDIADQYLAQEYRLMKEQNRTEIDLMNVAPTELWAFGSSDRNTQKAMHPFKSIARKQNDWLNDTETNMGDDASSETWTFDLGSNETWTFQPFGANEQNENPYYNISTDNETADFDGADDSGYTLPEPRDEMARNGEDYGDYDYGAYGDYGEDDDDDDDREEVEEYHPRHHDHHGKNKKHHHGFHFDLTKMTESQAKNVASFYISIAMIFMFFYASFCYLLFQGFYICCINRVMQPQMKLENHFMGPENAIAQNREPQAPQPTIQYIQVPQQQMQPQYVQQIQQPVMMPRPSTGNVQASSNGLV